jgi:hypothetical protein
MSIMSAGLALIADIAPSDWYGCQKLCWGAGGRGSRGRERRFRQQGLYTAYALFEALSVADMVGPSRRAPVHAEVMHFYGEHKWLP